MTKADTSITNNNTYKQQCTCNRMNTSMPAAYAVSEVLVWCLSFFFHV